MDMIVKVCGLKERENLESILRCQPDMVGFNFYPLSKRYVSKPWPGLSEEITKVGVFVNSSMSDILEKKETFQLDYAQLHGDETPETAWSVQQLMPVIKVFRIHPEFDFSIMESYAFCSYFLFDTYTDAYGGSGAKFDWQILNQQEIPVSFLLSGGIGPDDLHSIKSVNHPQFAGVDINSRFETLPGIKDVPKVCSFIQNLKQK
jgi:phosphoribosylanthranilate isomerase